MRSCPLASHGCSPSVLAVIMSVSPQHAQLVLQVSDPLDQSGSVGLSPLIGLPASLLHLPLIPALHLRRHRLEEVLGHLQGVHVVLLLSEGGFTGLVSKDLQSPDPCGPSGLSPALGILLAVLPSVPPSLPVSNPGFSPAAAAPLRGWRQAAGSVNPAPPVPTLRVLVLPLGADRRTLLRPNHLDG